MAKKKPPSVKLDATVKATHPGMRHTDSLPERKKSVGAFRRAFREDALATLWLRNFDEKKGEFYLTKVECLLLEASVNCFYYEDEDERKRSKPWWSVYNFEIEGSEEPIVTPAPSRDDQLSGEQRPGDVGGDLDDGDHEWDNKESANI